jgi:predicted Fe-Mo cluster-binding NifX family protein
METKNIKVAFVTDDGNTISQHFGRALYYEVLTVEQHTVTHRERRDKAGHHTFHSQNGHENHHAAGHGFDEHSQHKHQTMTSNIADCTILVARGMGNGAYQHLLSVNIKPIITNAPTIENAIKELMNGTMVNHIEKLH